MKLSKQVFISLLSGIAATAMGCLGSTGDGDTELPPGFSIVGDDVPKGEASRVWIESNESGHGFLVRSRKPVPCPGRGLQTTCAVDRIQIINSLAPSGSANAAEIIERIEANTIVFDAVISNGLGMSSDGELGINGATVSLVSAYRGLWDAKESNMAGTGPDEAALHGWGRYRGGVDYDRWDLFLDDTLVHCLYGNRIAYNTGLEEAFDAIGAPDGPALVTVHFSVSPSRNCLLDVVQVYEEITPAIPDPE
ncbi:MAG: hypothetical protein IPL79_17190 [Myxococcales bacterium]|nr:hypothetical protein [Myxococcales bacterium]